MLQELTLKEKAKLIKERLKEDVPLEGLEKFYAFLGLH